MSLFLIFLLLCVYACTDVHTTQGTCEGQRTALCSLAFYLYAGLGAQTQAISLRSELSMFAR